MDKKLTTHKLTPEALRLIRLIAAATGELQYNALERILRAEWERVQAEAARGRRDGEK